VKHIATKLCKPSFPPLVSSLHAKPSSKAHDQISLYINPSICSEKVSEGLLCCGVLLQNMQSSD